MLGKEYEMKHGAWGWGFGVGRKEITNLNLIYNFIYIYILMAYNLVGPQNLTYEV